jgi:transcriptional regulator with XRE-family HTH domain
MRLKAFRAARGWSQATLAKKVGITREYLARIETAKHDPSLSLLLRLAKALRVKPSRLLD